MRKLNLLIALALGGCLLAGCSQKTPEEIEADKYPKAKPNTPEQDAALRAKFDINRRGSSGAPTTRTTTPNTAPGSAAGPG